MICSRMFAFSLLLESMNFGRLMASSSTKLSRSPCPPLCPDGSMTFKSEFLPLRSMIRPLLMTMCRLGGVTDPSRVAWDGLYLFPPSAHAMESMTLVFPWLLFPPMMVNPFALGSILTALTRFTFSISSLFILIPVM